MSLAYSDAPFYWPLRGSIALQNGSGTPTFTRTTAKWVFDNEGKLITVPANAAAFSGARMVRNYFPSSTDLTGHTSVAAGTGTISAKILELVTDPTGGSSNATRLTCSLNGGVTTSDIARIYKSGGVALNATATQSYYIKTVDGSTKDLKIWWGSSGETKTITGTWTRFEYTGTSSTDSTAYIGLRGGQSPATSDAIDIYIWGAQLEDVSGQIDQTASEYVSKGTLVAPYHGAGVDGIKWFTTNKDGSTILENNLLGLVIVPTAITNTMLYCRDFTNAVWVKTNAIAAKTQIGLDNAANSCSLLTANDANATILQTITAAAAAGCTGFYVKRSVGTGTIFITRDGGANWTDITSLINSSMFTLVKIENTSVTNPEVGFKITTSGDAIIVDAGINHLGTILDGPIITTTVAVTVNSDSLTAPTSSNFSDLAGTIVATVTKDTWTTGNGSIVGSTTRGLYTSASNSGVQGIDGTNTVNGPTGAPILQRKIGIRYSGSSLQAFAGNNFGSVGSYDGSFNLTNISIASGARSGIKDIAIWQSSLTDSQITEINSNIADLVSSHTISYSNIDHYTITSGLVSMPNITSNIYNCQFRLGSVNTPTSINYNNINSIIYAGSLNITPSINNYFNNCQYRPANADSSINTSYNLINCIINTGRLDSISNIDSSIYNCQYRLSNANIIGTTTTNVLNNYKINTGFLITSNIVSSLVNKNIIYSIKLDAEYSVPVIQVNYLIN